MGKKDLKNLSCFREKSIQWTQEHTSSFELPEWTLSYLKSGIHLKTKDFMSQPLMKGSVEYDLKWLLMQCQILLVIHNWIQGNLEGESGNLSEVT